MSRPCKREFDYAYDSCIYGIKYKLLAETFNCTFALFGNNFNMSVNDHLEECKIIDVTRNGSDTFYDIIKDIYQGK